MPQTSSPPPSRSSRALCSLMSAWRSGEEREVLSFLPRVRRPRRLTLLPRPVSLATLHAAVLAAAGQPLDAAPASPARPPAPAPPPPALPERSPADGGGGGGAAGGGKDGGEGAGEGKVRVLVVDDDPGQRKVTRITPPVTRIPPPALPALSRAGEGHGPARPAYSNMPAGLAHVPPPPWTERAARAAVSESRAALSESPSSALGRRPPPAPAPCPPPHPRPRPSRPPPPPRHPRRLPASARARRGAGGPGRGGVRGRQGRRRGAGRRRRGRRREVSRATRAAGAA